MAIILEQIKTESQIFRFKAYIYIYAGLGWSRMGEKKKWKKKKIKNKQNVCILEPHKQIPS